MTKQSNKRKFLATTLTATMVAAAVAPVAGAAAADTKVFPDVPVDHPYAGVIADMVEAGVIKGQPDGNFNVHGLMTRAEAALIVASLLDLPTSSGANTTDFEDVKDNAWYTGAINSLKAEDIIAGKTATTFAPNAEITRAELSLLLVEAYGLQDKNVDDVELPFTDVKEDVWYTDAIKILYSEGLIKGIDAAQTKFAPNDNMKRGDFAWLSANVDYAHGDKLPKPEEPVVEAKVESVTAANGKLTVKMNTELETTPISSEFKVVQNINGTTKAVAASSVAYDEATKTVSLTVPELSATEVDQNVSYTVAYKETAAVSSNSFTIAKVGELQATGATQISSTQIKVQFNQKVTAATAEDLANYKIGKADADGKIDGTYAAFTETDTSAVLQEDEQSVIITLGASEQATSVLGAAGQFDNNTSFLLEVSNDVLPQAGKAAEQNAELPFSLKDSGKPTVEKFVVNEAGDLVVSFNEKLNATAAKVVINGQSLTAVPAYSATTGKSTVTFTKSQLTDAKPTGFALELGKTYSVSVADAEDAYGTAMNIYTSQFTYTTAADAPQVTKVESKNEKSVTVTFSEPVFKVGAGTTALDAASFNITKGAKHFTPATVTSNTAGTVYTLTFATADQADDFIFDSYKNETSVALDIHVSDIKDNVGNITPASKHTVTVLKDTVKPEVVKKENKADGVVDLTFNKAFNAAVTSASVAGKAYVLTSTGVKYPLGSGDVTVTASPQGKLAFDLDTVNATQLAAGNYTLVLEKDAVVDTALNGGNKNNEIRVPFIIAADGLEDKPVVTNVDATGTPGEIVVTFAEQVSYESAAKAANYTLDGNALPAASEFALDADGKVLTITLPEATYKESGDKVLKVNGVRNLAGTVMDEYEQVLAVSENEKIELKSGKVVNGDLILTFNENVNAADVTTAFAETDFIVKVNGVSVAVDSGDVEEHDAVGDATKVAKNQVRISAPTGVSFATGTITVEVKEDAAAKDKAGNGAKAVTITATR